MVTGVPGGRARSALAAGPGERFSDVRWVAETGSTNADGLALLRDGEPEGIVLVADSQTAGRGRFDRTWEAPPGAGLLVSVVLRPPAPVVEACTMAVAVAAVEALVDVAGIRAGLKWPNDLVWPGDGSAPDRKLAGILAEADWPAGSTDDAGYRPPRPGERLGLVVGIGINVSWDGPLPEELADRAVTCEQIAGTAPDREDLLVALLRRLDGWYGPLVRSLDAGPLREAWRAASATLGRRVRVDLGRDDVVGTAVDVTEDGHLVVEALEGGRRVIATGDVVHLRDEG
jgi:BirA family transcriptional regulator, biotin operon repressor / biotin---[acetyl-CoA-carboxylase] ligase